MNRLTDNDRNFGPFTLARWRKRFGVAIESGDDEDPESTFLLTAFGWALRIRIPNWCIRPYKVKVQAHWDEATVKRLGRNWYYDVTPREYGICLSDIGNGYDFLQIHYGRQTHDSSTTKSWCKHLPWKQWSHVRHSLYGPDGSHFYTEPKGVSFLEGFYPHKQKCPKACFGFEDFDGDMIVATCIIEEREWHFGTGWFKWLKWFRKPKVRRSLDLAFSAEVGPEKGSWKGGITGHGIEMNPGETPRDAFERYCTMDHGRKGRKYRLRFIGPCEPLAQAAVPTAGESTPDSEKPEMPAK